MRRIVTTATVFFLVVPCSMGYADTLKVIWQGSYTADGTCYCTETLPPGLAQKIVPTPIGGQSVEQVCQRIGSGPDLVFQNGQFNYTVYEDAQCGNSLYTADTKIQNDVCAVSEQDQCVKPGPVWNLRAAYSSDSPVLAAAISEDAANNHVNSSDSSTHKEKALVAETAKLKKPALDDVPDSEQASVATKPASSEEVGISVDHEADVPWQERMDSFLSTFRGRVVKIQGKNYLQARDDVPAYSGDAGSRIIVDNIVFLLSHENINFDDLYVDDDSLSSKKNNVPVSVKNNINAKKAGDQPDNVISTEDRKKHIRQLIDKARARLADKKELQAHQRELEKEQKSPVKKNTKKKSNAEQIKAEQIKAEQAKAEQAKAEQAKAEQAKAEQAKAEQAKAEQAKAEQAKAEQAKAEQAKAEQSDVRQRTAIEETVRQAGAGTEQRRVTVPEAGPQSSIRGTSRLSPVTRQGHTEKYGYLEAMPVTYEVGGSGISLAGSGQTDSRIRYMGRIGVAETYREVMVGAGYFFSPQVVDRLTVALLTGIEHGSFELQDPVRAPGLLVTSSGTGVFLSASTRFNVSRKFELKAGMGYSSFFEGDTVLFGGGYYHMTPRLDVISRFEVGDNDSLGIGFRYFYK